MTLRIIPLCQSGSDTSKEEGTDYGKQWSGEAKKNGELLQRDISHKISLTINPLSPYNISVLL